MKVTNPNMIQIARKTNYDLGINWILINYEVRLIKQLFVVH